LLIGILHVRHITKQRQTADTHKKETKQNKNTVQRKKKKKETKQNAENRRGHASSELSSLWVVGGNFGNVETKLGYRNKGKRKGRYIRQADN